MYGTYCGFSLPLSTLAALVAKRPRVWPLASTTYHLRSIFLPLGTKVDISLLPLPFPDRAHSRPKNPRAKRAAPCQLHGLKLHPLAKHTCSGEDRPGYARAAGLALGWAPDSADSRD